MFILAFIGSAAGMMAFTLQQTICISTCPPEHEYFPLVRDGKASLGILYNFFFTKNVIVLS